MKTPEMIQEYLNNNDCSEHPEYCAVCNGKCCKNYAGGYAPYQLFDTEEDITVENIKKLLLNTPVIVDMWENYELNGNKCNGYYIRPTHSSSGSIPAMFKLFQLLFPDDDFVNAHTNFNDNPYVDKSFGGTCSHFINGKGCDLSIEERPIECVTLVAKDKTGEKCTPHISKYEVAQMWEPYFDVIEKALSELT